MVKLVVCSAAEADYAQALNWYAGRSVQAAERFDEEFAAVLEAIALDPQRFPRCNARHRYYLLHHYPFQVIFRESGDDVAVIAVAHTKRNSSFWQGR